MLGCKPVNTPMDLNKKTMWHGLLLKKSANREIQIYTETSWLGVSISGNAKLQKKKRKGFSPEIDIFEFEFTVAGKR